ncbi:hypothetical protein BZL29_5354 [Mycobacterium kansasii]|uniref:Uncharacterized protein n=1 Tax=Mycobacterium kansasii TaxID=1768 RepID=A0A1V3X2U5_MYCKA|nr:hypothetical protein BZL29_5354 [Mycobacterium kansasii]
MSNRWQPGDTLGWRTRPQIPGGGRGCGLWCSYLAVFKQTK